MSEINTQGYVLEVYRDPEDGSWVADVPDLPGCVAAGDTPLEALELAEDAIDAWIEAAIVDGRVVPPPRRTDADYSGRFLQRLPKGLHRRLAIEAAREGVSLNAYCTAVLSEAVGRASGKRQAVVDLLAQAAPLYALGAGHATARSVSAVPVRSGSDWATVPGVAEGVQRTVAILSARASSTERRA